MSAGLTIIDHPLVADRLSFLRRKETEAADFRRALRWIGSWLAYEVTRTLPVARRTIETPLVRMDAPVIEPRSIPCLISILRAGNGLLDGMLDVLPDAPVGHVGLARDHVTLEAIEYYFRVPEEITTRRTLVLDPMLATGHSAIAAITRVKEAGAADLVYVNLVAAPNGIAAMEEAHPDVPIFTCSVDERLNEKGYIVPGLGDAGDRLYGTV